MPCSEKVIWTLIHPRKACYPALCPKCVETVESAGKDLICVRLMADVKNDLVPFRVEGSQLRVFNSLYVRPLRPLKSFTDLSMLTDISPSIYFDGID